MKKIFLKAIITLFPFSLYAIGGFGLNIPYSTFTVDQSSSPLTVDILGEPTRVGQIDRFGFENAYGFGGYLYIDMIPFIDIDAEFNLMGNLYDFSFSNDKIELANINPDTLNFAFFTGNTYITIQKSIFKLGIPFLAKAKLSAGAGLNQHTSTPFIDQEMMESFVKDEDGNTDLQNGEFDSAALEDYLADNLVESTGFHLQTGLQFRLLTFDLFAFYRYTIASDVIPGANGFSSLNVRLGLGI
tara:strand:+ start:650 stop:1378 length:729 start_codon:yes stop_codon:yes gene_type:complete